MLHCPPKKCSQRTTLIPPKNIPLNLLHVVLYKPTRCKSPELSRYSTFVRYSLIILWIAAVGALFLISKRVNFSTSHRVPKQRCYGLKRNSPCLTVQIHSSSIISEQQGRCVQAFPKLSLGRFRVFRNSKSHLNIMRTLQSF